MAALRIEAMTTDDWPDVRRIYAEGIATGDATLEREAPDWAHFDHSHRHDCRLVARDRAGGPILGWIALTAYSARKVYAGVAWESVYVGASARGRGVGRALLEAVIAGVGGRRAVDAARRRVGGERCEPGLHEAAGFRRIGVQRAIGQDATGRWRDVILLERRSAVVGAER